MKLQLCNQDFTYVFQIKFFVEHLHITPPLLRRLPSLLISLSSTRKAIDDLKCLI